MSHKVYLYHHKEATQSRRRPKQQEFDERINPLTQSTEFLARSCQWVAIPI